MLSLSIPALCRAMFKADLSDKTVRLLTLGNKVGTPLAGLQIPNEVASLFLELAKTLDTVLA